MNDFLVLERGELLKAQKSFIADRKTINAPRCVSDDIERHLVKSLFEPRIVGVLNNFCDCLRNFVRAQNCNVHLKTPSSAAVTAATATATAAARTTLNIHEKKSVAALKELDAVFLEIIARRARVMNVAHGTDKH